MKKITLFIGFIVVVVVVFGVIEIFKKYSQGNKQLLIENSCLESIGYFFNFELGLCVSGQEVNSKDKIRAVKLALKKVKEGSKADNISYSLLGILEKDCEGCFSILFKKLNNVIIVDILNWEYISIRPKSINNVKSDSFNLDDESINIQYPIAWSLVSSPLKIKGEVKGFWFFEGSFPIFLKDKDGNILAETKVKAQAEWMTENLVPFELDLVFKETGNKYSYGVLIFKKDNPSGLLENSKEFSIPIYFK